MTTLKATQTDGSRASLVRGAAGWLGLTASPTFALMAWISVNGASQTTICSSASGGLPINGMACMYLLMSVFHLSPWLKLASGRPRQLTQPATEPEGD
jgi:hypothetical protein